MLFGVLGFAATLATFYGLATMVKPFGWVRRRKTGAALVGVSFLIWVAAAIGAQLAQPPLSPGERTPTIAEAGRAGAPARSETAGQSQRIDACAQSNDADATCAAEDNFAAQRAAGAAEGQSAPRARDQEEGGGDQSAREIVWIERTKAAVRASLRNPNSAVFRNVALYRPFVGRDTPVVCGEVNGENGFGGMTGFQGFIGAGSSIGPFLEEQMAPGEFAQSRREFCFNAAQSAH